ncbi:carbonate dehydratase [Psychromonas antarctica]|uniref:carbonate dehydratase n=1 Tax=Psychromonas antarctica TaxID=67573 RepID=UPI001EE8B1D2|nr:carbonate dehydratase [Psychromonas antarctica]MCG6200139.1 carbonate dehydratase [Psychromonas antarctica]
MSLLDELLKRNEEWAAKINKEDPTFFSQLAEQQSPDYLWIGCSDSRVPAIQLLGMMPGDIFVHRNIANLVIHTDLSCMSVIQYAVDVLKVKHIIVTGHYDCGGIKAAMKKQSYDLIDGWLRNIKDTYVKYSDSFDEQMTDEQRLNYLTELNVIEQAKNVCHTTCVQQAWARGQALTVHGFIYSVKDGRLKDLNMNFDNLDKINDLYHIG